LRQQILSSKLSQFDSNFQNLLNAICDCKSATNCATANPCNWTQCLKSKAVNLQNRAKGKRSHAFFAATDAMKKGEFRNIHFGINLNKISFVTRLRMIIILVTSQCSCAYSQDNQTHLFFIRTILKEQEAQF